MKTLLFILLLVASGASFAEGCKREPIASWTVRIVNGRPFVDGTINGAKVNVQVDTTAYASLITWSTARRLKLKIDYGAEYDRERTLGVATLDELRIGDKATKGLTVRVTQDLAEGVDFILGAEFAHAYDLELDLPRRLVRVFDPSSCPQESLAYRDPGAAEVELQKAVGTLLPVTVNGKAGVAILHSGINVSSISPAFAEEVGIKRGAEELLPAGCSEDKPMWMSTFDVSIGGRTFKGARLYVAPTRGAVDMYLGDDFLRSHRVIVSHSRNAMYFTYTGGVPFTASPWLKCDESTIGKGRQEILDDLDAILARNAKDVDALLRRASRQRRDRPKEALADAHAAITIDSRNPAAFSLRAEIHANLKDYRAAIADLDRVISLGFETAEIHTMRGEHHWKLGDYSRAIDDYTQSLRIDPTYPAPLYRRGKLHYYAGRYEEAGRDFAGLVVLSPTVDNQIWLSMARARRGLDIRPLEAARASLKDDRWHASILDYLLGRIDRESFIARATVEDRKVRRERLCEANYHVAQRLLAGGKRAEGRALLERVAEECPEDYEERESAQIELKGLS